MGREDDRHRGAGHGVAVILGVETRTSTSTWLWPWTLSNRLRGLSTKELVSVAARFRLGTDPDDVRTATRFALRSVARRHGALSEEIAELDAQLDRLVGQGAPELVSLPGIGTENAARLLIVAGDNPQRLGSEAPFASLLCGVSPIEASSGKVVLGTVSTAAATGKPTVRCR